MQPGRDKMRRRTPNRGNSVRARTFPRTTVVSRETLLKVESRDSFVDVFVGSVRFVSIESACLHEKSYVARVSVFLLYQLLLQVALLLYESLALAALVGASSRFQVNGEFQYALFL